jgi:hypothetical protein
MRSPFGGRGPISALTATLLLAGTVVSTSTVTMTELVQTTVTLIVTVPG